MTIEVFKTNIQTPTEVTEMTIRILEHLSGCRITFDLEDCDKVMRISAENGAFDVNAVVQIANQLAKDVQLLEDDASPYRLL